MGEDKMSLSHGSSIVKDGLVFAYDMGSKQSWKGKPTTNYIVSQNAIQETSYAPHIYTTSGTWLQKHTNAIIAHNSSGSTLASYVNTGVTDWTNTYHAHWQYDGELRKPVVVMEDFDGAWKAKSFSTGQSFNSMGLAAGDTYSISWLQWTDNLSKIANAGLYMRNSSGSWGFHAGQALAQPTAFNTKLYTWERVYATFTVPANMNMDNTNQIYMYGHYSVRATVKVADVQFETGTASGYSPVTTRSNTESIIDWTGNNTSLTMPVGTEYFSDDSFKFSGLGDLNTGLFSGRDPSTDPFTVEAWVKCDGLLNVMWVDVGSNGTNQRFYSTLLHSNAGNPMGIQATAWSQGTAQDTDWHHQVIVMDGTTAKGYCDGVLVHTRPYTSYTLPSTIRFAGRASYYWDGSIDVARIYDRALTDEEVHRNFNALRGRFGI